MSLGSRIATKARATVRVSLNSTPREPLYFLYPQWCRNSSSASARPVHEQAGLPQGEKTISHPQHTSADSSSSKSQSEHLNGRSRPVKEVTAEAENLQWRPMYDEASHTSPDLNSAPLSKKIEFKDRPQSKSKAIETTSNFQRAPLARKIFMLPPVPPLQAVRKIKQMIIRGKRKDGPRQDNRHREDIHGHSDEGSLYTQRLQQMREEVEEPPIVDWRDILSDLQLYTPTHGPWLEGALRIVVPEESTEQIVNAIDGHIWETASNYNCSIKMAKAPSKADGTTFIASGSLSSLGKLIAELTLAAPNLRTFAADQPVPDDSFESRWKKTRLRVTTSSSITARQGMSVTQLSRPDEWTPENFLTYIQTILEMTNHVKRVHFREDPSRASWQIQELAAIFQHPECKISITRAAFHDTMLYYIRINQIRELRNLFIIMSRENMEMTTETFNIMLRGAAKSRNLVAFRFVLHIMLRRYCVPNYDTWFAFMESSNDIEIRQHVADAMKVKGLLGHKSAVKKLVFSLVSQEIEVSLNSNEHPKEFIENMDTRFTPLWLSVASGARILYALASRGLISRCWVFLHFMQSRNIHPNTVCINIVLHHCKSQDNLEGIIEFLRSLPPTSRYVPDKDTFHGLFFMAWKGHNYNLVRVVWRYACLYGATSSYMRRLILNSIRKAASQRSHRVEKELLRSFQKKEARFRQYVGPVVFGRHYYGDHPADTFRSEVVDTHHLITTHGKTTSQSETELGYGVGNTSKERMTYGVNEDEDSVDDSDPAWSFNTSDEGEAEPKYEEQLDLFDGREKQEKGSPELGAKTRTESPEPSPQSQRNKRQQKRYKRRIQREELSRLTAESLTASPAQNGQAGTTPAIADLPLNPLGPVYLFGDGSLHETAQPPGEKLVSHKLGILEDLSTLDLKVYQHWRPVKPMSLVLVEAAEKDRKWHQLKLDAEQRGEVETTAQQMYDVKERMIDDAIGIKIESRDKPWVSRMWD